MSNGYTEEWLRDYQAKHRGLKIEILSVEPQVNKYRRQQPSPDSPVAFAVPGPPVPKPRQTRSDKWKQRPCVVRYREWADKARQCMFAATGTVSITIGRLEVVAYFPLPKRLAKSTELRGVQHMVKPDADNVLKAVADSLCRNDQMIHTMSIKKRWEDANGPRVEITLY